MRKKLSFVIRPVRGLVIYLFYAFFCCRNFIYLLYLIPNFTILNINSHSSDPLTDQWFLTSSFIPRINLLTELYPVAFTLFCVVVISSTISSLIYVISVQTSSSLYSSSGPVIGASDLFPDCSVLTSDSIPQIIALSTSPSLNESSVGSYCYVTQYLNSFSKYCPVMTNRWQSQNFLTQQTHYYGWRSVLPRSALLPISKRLPSLLFFQNKGANVISYNKSPYFSFVEWIMLWLN